MRHSAGQHQRTVRIRWRTVSSMHWPAQAEAQGRLQATVPRHRHRSNVPRHSSLLQASCSTKLTRSSASHDAQPSPAARLHGTRLSIRLCSTQLPRLPSASRLLDPRRPLLLAHQVAPRPQARRCTTPCATGTACPQTTIPTRRMPASAPAEALSPSARPTALASLAASTTAPLRPIVASSPPPPSA